MITVRVPRSDAPKSCTSMLILVAELTSMIDSPDKTFELRTLIYRARVALISLMGTNGIFDTELAAWMSSRVYPGSLAQLFMASTTDRDQQVFAAALRLLIVGQNDIEAKVARGRIGEQVRKATWVRMKRNGKTSSLNTPTQAAAEAMIDDAIIEANGMMLIRGTPDPARLLLMLLKRCISVDSTMTVQLTDNESVLVGDKEIMLSKSEVGFLKCLFLSPRQALRLKDVGLKHVAGMVSRMKRSFRRAGIELSFVSSKGVYRLESIRFCRPMTEISA